MSEKLKEQLGRYYSPETHPPTKARRPQNAREDTWIIDLLGRVQVGYFATRWDQQTFINPSTFWYDTERHEIYFHSNQVGRIRANSERHDEVCFAASEVGKPLPSNIALEFSIQYRSIVAFGKIRVLSKKDEQEHALYGLIKKYFPTMIAGNEYRPITAEELKRTSVYAIAVEYWSGKENWVERADQSDEWPALAASWFS